MAGTGLPQSWKFLWANKLLNDLHLLTGKANQDHSDRFKFNWQKLSPMKSYVGENFNRITH